MALEHILAEMLAAQQVVGKQLPNGAWLKWLPAQHTLIAARHNKRLEPKEAAVFEAFIRKAGYEPSNRRDFVGPDDLNQYFGVAWDITRAAKPAAQQEVLL